MRPTALLLIALTLAPLASASAQQDTTHYTHADTLRGSNGPGRAWWDAAFYVAAQFAGGIVGTLAAAQILGRVIAHPTVAFAVTVPGMGGPWVAFVAEIAIAFILMTTILVVSNTKSLARYTGLFAGSLVALYITLEAPLSGMSLNPARTLGSAFAASQYTALWVYFAAPLAGMLLAAEVYLRTGRARVAHCAKLHHENDQPCIFLCRYGELR